MTEIAVKDFFPPEFPVYVKDIEIQNGPMIPTYFLLKKLEAEFSRDSENRKRKFYFMMGSDLIPTLLKWDNGQELVDEMNFLVFERKGYEHILDGEKKDYPLPRSFKAIKA